ncbi:MAG: sigma-70 family RNA polymerase sigma factor [Armatimonadetes bacterium]|nr:sigma-70 family RNA polymerase sigma factor [Armatimonadota bacterium]
MKQSTRNKLTEENIQELLGVYSKTRDVSVRDTIVLQYNNLVESIARRFVGASEPLEDLIQEGFIGLIGAVDLYDASKGVKFSTYATHFIIGQIKHYLRDKGKIIKEPAWLQELNQRMTRVIDSLSQKHGRPPTEREIGEVMSMPEETVAEFLTTREVFKVSSLDGGLERDDGSGFPVDPDKIKDQKCISFQLPAEDRIVLGAAMDRLKEIEQQVIYEFFYLDLNQTEIARKLGISCNYVSHILRNSTKKLKKILVTEELRDTQIQMSQLSRRLQGQQAASDEFSVLDSITGVYTRKYFLDRLDEEVSRAYRYKHHLAILLVQIDIPDSVGRLTKLFRTEDVIQQTAETLRASVRRADVVTRFQDRVFALILPHTASHAAVVAERIQKKITGSASGASAIPIEVSVSWASYPKHGANSAELISFALLDLGVTDDSDDIKRAA